MFQKEVTAPFHTRSVENPHIPENHFTLYRLAQIQANTVAFRSMQLTDPPTKESEIQTLPQELSPKWRFTNKGLNNDLSNEKNNKKREQYEHQIVLLFIERHHYLTLEHFL